MVSPAVAFKLIQQNKKLAGNDFNEAYSPLVVVGPSGAGKGTLIAVLQKEFPNMFAFSVSYTTRSIRANEVDGVNYNFVTKEKF